MLEIIDDVLQAEEKADELLSEARAEATRIRNDFAERESRTVREAQAAADKELRERLAVAREQEARRVAEADRRIRSDAASFAAEEAPGMDDAVARAVALVKGER